MLCKIVTLVALLSLSMADWESYKRAHNKFYSPEEDNNRREIFERNVRTIKAHNNRFKQKKVSHRMALTKFSDMSKDELEKLVAQPLDMLPSSLAKRRLNMPLFPNVTLPASINWVERGCVTPAKTQKNCGSCWAFAAIAALESHYCIATEKLYSFSEQYILDCSGAGSCAKGFMDKALEFVQQKGHVALEKDNVYVGVQQSCQDPLSPFKLQIEDVVQLSGEAALQQAVAFAGPVSVGFTIHTETFSQLDNGTEIFYDPICNTVNETNHALLVVGYGSENGEDFWLAKNSWGPEFRNNGFIKIARNRENHCGISNFAYYPKLSAEQPSPYN